MLVTGQNHIYRISEYQRHNVTVDGGVDTEADRERRGDDKQVENKYHTAIADGSELVDNHSHNIRTSGRAALHQGDGYAETRDDTTDAHRQKAVYMQKIIGREDILPDVHRHR